MRVMCIEYPFDNRYIVYSNGTVMVKKNGSIKEANQYTTEKGYKYIATCKNGVRKNIRVHVMVAQCFIPNPDNKPQVNHKNGKRADNHVENLEWCTSRENTLHGFRCNGRKMSDKQINLAKLRQSGELNISSKLSASDVIEIRRMRAEGKLLREICVVYGISDAHVSAIVNRKFWKTIGDNNHLLNS